ncbi:hypothetical protein E2C01_049885 [Portunus trituberculatus]|uniref:Uncharacterized protein n=1 Tax=Portunus trituberculatus TaxID=210409 RepID=A0A5B7GEZ1_PORTR|nr:hypothetical protein [Portunus trituberculatus]
MSTSSVKKSVCWRVNQERNNRSTVNARGHARIWAQHTAGRRGAHVQVQQSAGEPPDVEYTSVRGAPPPPTDCLCPYNKESPPPPACPQPLHFIANALLQPERQHTELRSQHQHLIAPLNPPGREPLSTPPPSSSGSPTSGVVTARSLRWVPSPQGLRHDPQPRPRSPGFCCTFKRMIQILMTTCVSFDTKNKAINSRRRQQVP